VYLSIGKPKILAVIVLYEKSLTDCTSLHSLLRSSSNGAAPQILIVDNSSAPQNEEDLPAGTMYLSCPQNLGLAHAYNRALELGEREQYDWLLTLDQDTELPSDFISKANAAIERSSDMPSVAAIVPQIVSGNEIVSPYFYRFGAIPTWFKGGYTGVSGRETYAFNSAALIRVDALRQAAGYDPYFWLDCSDTKMFLALHRIGKQVYIAGDIQVVHDFSMKRMNERVSAMRYEHMLLAESGFWDAERSWLAGMERTCRLGPRWAKHLLRRDNIALCKLTFRFLMLRLFRSRAYRLSLFRNSVEQRLGKDLAATALSARSPKVSVCMAAFNGGRYIEAQMASILPQLGSKDELIIVDDISQDDTVTKIIAMKDARIRLICHEKTLGVTGTFEEAIRHATGDILFLSDDDDIWAPHKVHLYLSAFARDPKVNVVTSEVALIDSEGRSYVDARATRRRPFRAGFFRNILRNRYQGSTMAFRSTLLGEILPIPRGHLFLHDAWIGTLNDRIGGRTTFLPQTLLFYRRHGNNFSRKMNLQELLRSRSWLLIDHLRRYFR
jgi:GT2 family glycosyltransferase